MNQNDFDALVHATTSSIKRLLTVKGGEYAGPVDRLGNFKRGAELTGTTPLQVAFVYASKHYDGIATYVRKDSKGEPQATSEPIEGRLDDLINYCILMKGLIQEQNSPQPCEANINPLNLSEAQTDKESKCNGTSSSPLDSRRDPNAVAVKTDLGFEVRPWRG